MKCDEAKSAIPLFLYNELPFDEEDALESHLDECESCRRELAHERLLHRAFDQTELSVTSDFLMQARQQLRSGIAEAHEGRQGSPWGRFLSRLNFRWHMPTVMQPLGALALIAIGFFGAHLLPPELAGRFSPAGVAGIPVTSRVRYVEPDTAGKVQIVIEETQQRTLSGNVDDDNIQRYLLAAAKDPTDPGLRGESVDLLMRHPESIEIRDALLYNLQHDANAGVRLKALEGLKGYGQEPEVRKALSHVLLADKNPGVRTQAIDLLIQQNNDHMTGLLQELMRKEENGYVRLRCEKALQEMRASPGTF
jgi:hypothetical protein